MEQPNADKLLEVADASRQPRLGQGSVLPSTVEVVDVSLAVLVVKEAAERAGANHGATADLPRPHEPFDCHLGGAA
jgi:hypothetical protein